MEYHRSAPGRSGGCASVRRTGRLGVTVPQEISVCLYQVGSESSAKAGDTASLHTVQTITCILCTRVVEPDDGLPVYMEDVLLGYVHEECAEPASVLALLRGRS